jgi:hypothetical protein
MPRASLQPEIYRLFFEYHPVARRALMHINMTPVTCHDFPVPMTNRCRDEAISSTFPTSPRKAGMSGVLTSCAI